MALVAMTMAEIHATSQPRGRNEAAVVNRAERTDSMLAPRQSDSAEVLKDSRPHNANRSTSPEHHNQSRTSLPCHQIAGASTDLFRGPSESAEKKQRDEGLQEPTRNHDPESASRPKRSYLSSKRRSEVQSWLGDIQPARGFSCVCSKPDPWAANGFGWRSDDSRPLDGASEPRPSVSSGAHPKSTASERRPAKNGTSTAAGSRPSTDIQVAPKGTTQSHPLRDRISNFFRRAKARSGSGKSFSRNIADMTGEFVPGAGVGSEWDADDQGGDHRPYCSACGLPINGMAVYRLSDPGVSSKVSLTAALVPENNFRETGFVKKINHENSGDFNGKATKGEVFGTGTNTNGDEEEEEEEDHDGKSSSGGKPKLALDASAARLRRAERLLKKTTSSNNNTNGKGVMVSRPRPTNMG